MWWLPGDGVQFLTDSNVVSVGGMLILVMLLYCWFDPFCGPMSCVKWTLLCATFAHMGWCIIVWSASGESTIFTCAEWAIANFDKADILVSGNVCHWCCWCLCSSGCVLYQLLLSLTCPLFQPIKIAMHFLLFAAWNHSWDICKFRLGTVLAHATHLAEAWVPPRPLQQLGQVTFATSCELVVRTGNRCASPCKNRYNVYCASDDIRAGMQLLATSTTLGAAARNFGMQFVASVRFTSCFVI